MGFTRAKADLESSRFSDLRWVAETDSTNDDVQAAMTSAGAGSASDLVIVADHQRRGRGRLGRSWEAPTGASLLMTVGTSVTIPPDRRGLLLAAMSTAAAAATAAVTGVELLVKWPNDLVVRDRGGGVDRKVAGVLAESFGLPSGGTGYAVGIGINCNWVRLPDSLVGVAESLDVLSGAPVDREALAAATVLGFETRLDSLAGGAEEVLAEARSRSATIGQTVVAHTDGSEVRGTAVDLDSDGALLVETGAGDPRRIVVGDVVNLRPV